MDNTNFKKVKDIPSDYLFISDSQDTEFFQNYYWNTIASKCDSFFVKLDSSGADYESIYGITGIVPIPDKPVHKVTI